MPSLAEIQRSQSKKLSQLKSMLQREPAGGVDKTFKEDENFSFAAARADSDQGKGKWFGVTARLYNFAIGVETGGSGALGSDDAQYVGICKCPSPRAVRTPEYTDLEEGVQRVPDQIFGAFSPLSGPPVRFGVFCNAYNNDGSEAWEGIVTALKGDVSTAMTLGINLLPGLAQFSTPGAVGKAISELISAALTDEPVPVSGDEILCDTIDRVHWYRKTESAKWTARKWVIHTLENKEAWYLSQWFITLSSAIMRYDYAAIPGSAYYATLSESLIVDVELALLDYAAIQALRGEPVEVLAKKYGVQPSAITSAHNSLRAAGPEEASARIHSALIRADEFK